MKPEQSKLETSGVKIHPENDVPEVAAVEVVEQEPGARAHKHRGAQARDPEKTPLSKLKKDKLGRVEKKSKALEAEAKKLERRNNALEAQTKDLEKRNEALEAETKDLSARMSKLESLFKGF